ncbi:MAG: glycosyltransferase [Rhodothermales bacterium]|nr:glycosyltransferase [Rhodothermales bacterium]MBO6779561.1 glycosyltransferase [Rhodothermales bacterium]
MANNPDYSSTVGVVVVTYTGQDLALRCLKALGRTSRPDVQVILVDNGSPGRTGDLVAERFPDVHVIRLDENRGYTGGVNAGLREALCRGLDYVAVLNDDAEVVDGRWLDAGIDALNENRSAGVLGWTMVQHDQAAGRELTTALLSSPEAQPTEHLNGFALLFPAALLKAIGIFDETYFVYADEDDLLARIRACGLSMLKCSVPLVHLGEATVGTGSAWAAGMQMRNSLRCALKHDGWPAFGRRVLRYLDVAVNPWPLDYRPADDAHRRIRLASGRAGGAVLLARAVWWNLRHARETRRIATTEHALAARVRAQGFRAPDRLAAPARYRSKPCERHLPEAVS